MVKEQSVGQRLFMKVARMEANRLYFAGMTWLNTVVCELEKITNNICS